MDLSTIEKLLFLLLGSLLTLLGAIVKSGIDRRTHVSNRVFEQRLEALNRVWQAFNEMKGLFASRTSLGYPECLGDLAVAESLEVVHQEYRPVDLRKLVHRALDRVPHAGIRLVRTRDDAGGVLQRPFSLTVAINLPEAVQGHRDRNRVKPRGERRVAAKLVKALVGP